MQITVVELQWTILELIGALDWLQIHKPIMDGIEPPATTVAQTVGMFLSDVKVVELFFRAGLPFWMIWPSKQLNCIHIDDLTLPLITPDMRIVMAPIKGSLILYQGPVNSPECIMVLRKHYESYLVIANPFLCTPIAVPQPASSGPAP